MDHHLREILTSVGGIDHCVTEFIRVSQTLYPPKVFHRFCPELLNGGKTQAGTPVHVQLLGSHPELMAANAARVASMGAPAIDLNFGCPAKTVNRSQGGAVLLQYPDVLFNVASAVRAAVPAHIPVTAKMRLGYLDKSLALENASALEASGIQWLTVHARTKTEGYKPPAYWDWIARIREQVKIPVLANGEIWTPDHADQCRRESGSDLLMIGRGLVAIPDLALQIKARERGEALTPMRWMEHLQLLKPLADRLPDLDNKNLTDRLKQWLHYLSLRSAEVGVIFQEVRKLREREAFFDGLQQASADLLAGRIGVAVEDK